MMRNEPGRAVVMLCWRACTLRMDAALRLMPGINDLRRPVVPLMYHAYLRISIVVGTKIKHYSLFLFVILFVRPDSVLSVLASCVCVCAFVGFFFSLYCSDLEPSVKVIYIFVLLLNPYHWL